MMDLKVFTDLVIVIKNGYVLLDEIWLLLYSSQQVQEGHFSSLTSHTSKRDSSSFWARKGYNFHLKYPTNRTVLDQNMPDYKWDIYEKSDFFVF